MKFRTGDILIWRSTGFWDTLGEHTIRLKGFHTGIILIGSSFGDISDCGLSPTNTYITFLIDKIYPIEEVIGQIWHRPNGSSLHVIKRLSGRKVSEKEMYNLWKKYTSLKKKSWYKTVHISIVAYLKFGGMVPKPGYKGQRYHLCSSLIGYIFTCLGFIQKKSQINNLLPVDFYNLRFYQTEKYERIDVFDKQTTTRKWLTTTLLISFCGYRPPDLRSKFVDKMLDGYNYPQDKNLLKKEWRYYN